MTNYIPQMKGKDLSKVSAKFLAASQDVIGEVSIKFDGHYTQLHYNAAMQILRVYTSSGAIVFTQHGWQLGNKNFIVEAEFIGTSEGKMGDRVNAGSLASWRSKSSKGEEFSIEDNVFKVFSVLSGEFTESIKNFHYVEKTEMSLSKASHDCKYFYDEGWEGVIWRQLNTPEIAGSRTNQMIKFKQTFTKTLTCINVIEGLGTIKGKVGSLLLEDSDGVVVKVGSGLTNKTRVPITAGSLYIGCQVNISYESFINTYIQPRVDQILLVTEDH